MLPTFPIAVVLVCLLPEVASHRQSVWEWHDYHGSSRELDSRCELLSQICYIWKAAYVMSRSILIIHFRDKLHFVDKHSSGLSLVKLLRHLVTSWHFIRIPTRNTVASNCSWAAWFASPLSAKNSDIYSGKKLIAQDWSYKFGQCFPLSWLLFLPSFLSASHQRLLLSSADLESLMRSGKVYGNSCNSTRVEETTGLSQLLLSTVVRYTSPVWLMFMLWRQCLELNFHFWNTSYCCMVV